MEKKSGGQGSRKPRRTWYLAPSLAAAIAVALGTVGMLSPAASAQADPGSGPITVTTPAASTKTSMSPAVLLSTDLPACHNVTQSVGAATPEAIPAATGTNIHWSGYVDHAPSPRRRPTTSAILWSSLLSRQSRLPRPTAEPATGPAWATGEPVRAM